MPCFAVLQTLDMKINPHRFAEPPRGVTHLLLAVNVHRTFTLSLTTLSGRTFPKNFVFLESNVC